MRGSGVILMLIRMSGVVVREPFDGEGFDVLDEVGSLEDCPTPTPCPVGPTILGPRQLDDLLDRHGCVEQQLGESAEPVGYQQRLLQRHGRQK